MITIVTPRMTVAQKRFFKQALYRAQSTGHKPSILPNLSSSECGEDIKQVLQGKLT